MFFTFPVIFADACLLLSLIVRNSSPSTSKLHTRTKDCKDKFSKTTLYHLCQHINLRDGSIKRHLILALLSRSKSNAGDKAAIRIIPFHDDSQSLCLNARSSSTFSPPHPPLVTIHRTKTSRLSNDALNDIGFKHVGWGKETAYSGWKWESRR